MPAGELSATSLRPVRRPVILPAKVRALLVSDYIYWMTETSETADAIIDGAMRALERHGTDRLSMTDICREARLSRGTLYRYFANREQVLDAVNRRIMSTMRETFDEAVAAYPDPDLRVRVMLRAMIEFPQRFPHMISLIEHEPASAITFLARELPVLAAVITEYLMPAYERVPAVMSGAITPTQVSEIFQRLITSTFLIPSPGSADLDESLADLWESFMSLAPTKKLAPASGRATKTTRVAATATKARARRTPGTA